MVPPAAQSAAVVCFIQLPLEALGHVVDLLDSGLDQGLAGLERAYPATTDQHPRRRPGGGATQHGLPYLGEKVRVECPVGLVDPGNVDRSRRMPDEQIFHERTYVDEHGVRVFLQ